jgi:hypothetical protein
MYPTELPHRVSQTPKEITNPKTPKRTNEDWAEKIKSARKTSADATARYEKETAQEPFTTMQNMRVYSAKVEELAAQIQLADYEAEHLSSQMKDLSGQIENLKRDRPDADDEDMKAKLEVLRKRVKAKRATSAKYIERTLNLKSERATFLESTSDIGASKRAQLLEKLLLEPTKQARKQRNRDGQNRWKQKLIEFYDSGKPASEKMMPDDETQVKPAKYKAIWCPVLQEYLLTEDVIAAHICPNSLSPALISHLTGAETETTMLLGNGILLTRSVGRQLDQGGIALIPARGIEDPIQLKLVVIDESIRSLSYGGKEKWDDLDGRILKFKNSSRPQKRLLYLRYAMTMLHAWRSKLPGYESLQSNIWPSRIIWASPGKYVRKSTLQSIGGLIGEHFEETFDDEEDLSSLSEISRNLTAKFQAVVDGMGSDDDDDDEDYQSS